MLWSLITLPALTGVALLLCGRRADRLAPVAAPVVAASTTVLAALNAVGRGEVSVPLLSGIPLSLGVDGLSAVMVVTVAALVTAVLVFAAGDLGRGEPPARFHGLMLVFAAAMLVTVTARNLVTLLLAWEIMGAASYALIGFHWSDPRRAASGLVAFLTTRAGDLGLYLAAGAVLAGGAATLALDALAETGGGWRDAAAAGILLAAFGKSAQLPFSFWLSRAMAGPSPVSALLHSATMVAAGAYLLLRLEPLLAATSWAGSVAAWGGLATAVALGAVAVCQSDLKQLLAASTCAQVGLMVAAAGMGGVVAGTGHLVAHAATKSLLFLGAGAWLTALGTRNLTGLRGAARAYPVVGVTFTIGALALAGVPPLALWPTKEGVLVAAHETSTPLFIAAYAAAVLGALYAGRALTLVWSRPVADTKKHWDGAETGTRRVNAAQALPLPVLAAATVVGGAAALPVVRTEFAALLDIPAPAITGPELLLSGAVAVAGVAGVAAVIRWRGDIPAPAPLAGWLGLESAARRFVAAPVLAAAHALARFDDRVLAAGTGSAARGVAELARRLAGFDDRALAAAVRGTAAASMAAARATTHGPERAIARAVGAVAAGARELARWARRPETGAVHQYYAQATVLMVLLAAVLLVLT
ncbi:NADH-quinone oxidoreductase subunit L [Nocardia otitidiscaviarum]|uniref:NADH-quinone oxidoreductase subunit L n=1 Tax=Nocardia otitidiscaviarum TaxID=1823 RepID=A0A516NJM0_9NOCA|nr:proton-conducting transporter membrane subunit [Nocardia otitidiscaviarum]MCP9618862.1 NADH-quinone oxidoreductase subunit L [Nocardia otitidiscaviarum]QDP79098.1 NADH-quinone oxidoreductase subunit L [Nocardia otitidiscaviarum]